MTDGKANEFNAVAVPSQEVMRKLLYLASTGSESVLNPFKTPDAANGAKARERDQAFERLVQLALGSPERVAQFHVELDALEERRIALLLRTEEELTEARGKLKRLHDEAPEITIENGTRRKVFRDFDRVRDETGAFVGRDVIKPESVSDNPRNWTESVVSDEMATQLMARRDRLIVAGEKFEQARERSADGKMSDQDMDKSRTEFGMLLDQEEQAIKVGRETGPVGRDRTLLTEITPPDPGVSAPVIK